MIINYWYRALHEFKGALSVVSSIGAVGHNNPDYVSIDHQRHALWLLRYGMLMQSKEHVARAVKAFEYGFKHQNPQGYFKNNVGVAPDIAVGGDAFFISAFCIAYKMLEETTEYPEELARIKALTPKLILAVTWLDKNKSTLLQQDNNAPNRLLFDAIAFYLSSKITSYTPHTRLGEAFIGEALQAQLDDGSFTEKGGYDSSYQAVSMINLAELYYHCDDEALKTTIKSRLEPASKWLITRIGNDGKVSPEGNSRTGLGQEMQSGKPKDINYAEVGLCAYYMSKILNNDALLQAAEKVVQYALKSGE